MKIINMIKQKNKGKFRARFSIDFGSVVISDWRLYEAESGFWAAAPRYNTVRPDGRQEQARPVQVDEKTMTLISRLAGDEYQGST